MNHFGFYHLTLCLYQILDFVLIHQMNQIQNKIMTYMALVNILVVMCSDEITINNGEDGIILDGTQQEELGCSVFNIQRVTARP